MSVGKRKRIAAKAPFLIHVFAFRWPKAFALYERRRRPLALHIHRLIIAASAPGFAAGALTKAELHAALRTYCLSGGYLWACKAGAPRLDLNGEPAGIVTEQEAAYAADILKERKATWRANRKFVPKKYRPTADKKMPRAAAVAEGSGAVLESQRHEGNEQRESSASPA